MNAKHSFLLSELALARVKPTLELRRQAAHWEQQVRIAERAIAHCESESDRAHFVRMRSLAAGQLARLERLIERRSQMAPVELQAVFGAARLNWLQESWYEAA